MVRGGDVVSDQEHRLPRLGTISQISRMHTDVINRLRRIGYAVRRSPAGEARAGRGGKGRRPATRTRLLPEVEQGAEASIFSCGWSLIAGSSYDFDGQRRGPEPWVLLQYTLSGGGILRRGGREQACGPGTLLVLPMPDRHRYWLPRGGSWEFAYASLRGAAPLRACARLLAMRGPVLTNEDETPLVHSLLSTVCDCLAADDLGPHAISERGYALAMRMLERADASDGRRALPEAYAALEAWCRQRVAGLTVATLARHLGITREHLSRRFLRDCGCSPGRFLGELRQEAALAALRSGATLAEAAQRAGLRTQVGLRRALRRNLGWSP